MRSYVSGHVMWISVCNVFVSLEPFRVEQCTVACSLLVLQRHLGLYFTVTFELIVQTGAASPVLQGFINC